MYNDYYGQQLGDDVELTEANTNDGSALLIPNTNDVSALLMPIEHQPGGGSSVNGILLAGGVLFLVWYFTQD